MRAMTAPAPAPISTWPFNSLQPTDRPSPLAFQIEPDATVVIPSPAPSNTARTAALAACCIERLYLICGSLLLCRLLLAKVLQSPLDRIYQCVFHSPWTFL